LNFIAQVVSPLLQKLGHSFIHVTDSSTSESIADHTLVQVHGSIPASETQFPSDKHIQWLTEKPVSAFQSGPSLEEIKRRMSGYRGVTKARLSNYIKLHDFLDWLEEKIPANQRSLFYTQSLLTNDFQVARTQWTHYVSPRRRNKQ
jgi:hypothetical protein